MPRVVILVPGLLGTELTFQTALDQTVPYWLNPALIARDGCLPMALDAGGNEPLPPKGKKLAAGNIMRTLYDALRRRLATGLPGNWLKTLYTYDWRLAPSQSVSGLVRGILDVATPSEPAYLVGHSLGGLLCVAAYKQLKASGHQDLIKKIVTLGTPHCGSYSISDVWGLRDPSTNDLAMMSGFVFSSIQFPPKVLAQLAKLKDDVIKTINTWPSVYALMPSYTGGNNPNDPLASQWYTITNHPSDLHISASWLQWSENVWRPFYQRVTDDPPRDVLKCVAGSGFRTAQRLLDPAKLDQVEALAWSDDGDGVVSCWSATCKSTDTVIVRSTHSLLPQDQVVIEKMPAWLLEERPPEPTPLPEQIENAAGTTATPNAAPDFSLFIPSLKPALILPGSNACVVGGCKC